ncbi:hypothetical protein [Oceanobacillus sp. CFH 90083]|uniref:hypothetical protein n=1 Tax=Oceanobacillus sp. CFH 90083 TaxID=2592336 RepID=UPI00128B7105|nr:hypothetical protein [Oceanobacillus sp. CFH 90083]
MSNRPHLHRQDDKDRKNIQTEPTPEAIHNGRPARENKSPKGLKDQPQTSEKNELAELTNEAKFTRKLLGIISIIFLIGSTAFNPMVSQDAAAEDIANQSSTEIESGFVLNDTSDLAIEAQDFAVGDFDGGTARMLIWDFTGDSEDQIQIMVDGEIIRESHTLTSNVAAYSVPVPSVVTIVGIDQANYAVKFPERKNVLFNTVAPGGANAYTLTPLVP